MNIKVRWFNWGIFRPRENSIGFPRLLPRTARGPRRRRRQGLEAEEATTSFFSLSFQEFSPSALWIHFVTIGWTRLSASAPVLCHRDVSLDAADVRLLRERRRKVGMASFQRFRPVKSGQKMDTIIRLRNPGHRFGGICVYRLNAYVANVTELSHKIHTQLKTKIPKRIDEDKIQ